MSTSEPPIDPQYVSLLYKVAEDFINGDPDAAHEKIANLINTCNDPVQRAGELAMVAIGMYAAITLETSDHTKHALYRLQSQELRNEIDALSDGRPIWGDDANG